MSCFSTLVLPFLHRLPPEVAHGLALKALSWQGIWRQEQDRDSTSQNMFPGLQVSVFGLSFPHPLGMAAGFDKNAHAVDGLFGLGFGAVEVGSVTPLPQPGNPKPRLFRLTKDRAILNRMGFNNDGHGDVVNRLRRRRCRGGIVGVNLGANKDSRDRIGDYVRGLEVFYEVASYVTINISSPNTQGLRDLQSTENLKSLLTRVLERRHDLHEQTGNRCPVLLKIAPDLSESELEEIAGEILGFEIDGVILSNTTVSRPVPPSPLSQEKGGLSGDPLFELSTRALARMYRHTQGQIPLVGVGGISSGLRAWQKIRAGASLLQLYSALVYQGPSVISDILTFLEKKRQEHQMTSLLEAVGTENTLWC